MRQAEGAAFAPARYHKIGHDKDAIEALFVTLFLEAHARAPERIVIDLDATDAPLHGHQEGGFFHGYYDCYCYLPLYIFCGRHLLAAKLRRANIDASAGAREEIARIVAQIRARWPRTGICLRADSGFAREELMAWCEENGVDYVFGLARNNRLVAKIARELRSARREASKTGRAARRFKDFKWSTLDSWSRRRRVIGKAEWTRGEANPRFIVTSLDRSRSAGQALYEEVYCARGDMENRIKERQADLFADRTPAPTMRANQLRLWFASFAYVLVCALRRLAASGEAGRAVPARLLFSSRSFADIIYREELERLGSAPGGPSIVHTLTHEQPPPGWRGHARLIDAPMLAEVGFPPAAAPKVFVCGPTPMVEAVAEAVVSLGHEPGRVKTERFGATGGG
jgi:DDE family transposase/flavin-dependent oxidoreductase